MTAVKYIGGIIRGTATERGAYTTTNLNAGWIWIETDTQNVYFWSGSAWIATAGPTATIIETNKTLVADSNTISATTNRTGQTLVNNGTKFVAANGSIFPSSSGTLSATNGRTWGVYMVAGGAQALGLCGSLTQLGSAPGFTTFAAADGQKGAKFTPAASSGAQSGLSTATTVTCRQWNPRIKMKFRLDDQDSTRLFFGFNTTGGAKTGDDPLNAAAGIMFGKIANVTDANWCIMHNDTSGATVIADLSAADNTIHQIEIRADDTNSKFWYSFDNAAEVGISTDIPAQTTGLGWIAEVETTDNTQPLFNIFWIEMESG